MTKSIPAPFARSRVRASLASLLVILAGPLGTGRAADAPTNAFQFMDLRPFATNSDLWTGRQFSAVPKGLHRFGGIPFVIGLPMGLNGMESARAGEHFPTEVTGIKVGRAARRLHLLHATIGPDKDGVPLAKVVFHYPDGSQEATRIGYGVHVRDWTTPAAEKRSVLFDPNSRLAWSENSQRGDGETRLFQTALENPRPGQEITSMDLVSLFSQATPFVLALSVEMPESGLPGNLPLPARKAIREMNEFPEAAYRRNFTVRVTDAKSGAPLTNAVASLTIAEDKEKTFWAETKTGGQGICRIAFPPQQTAGYTLWVHAPGRMPALISESRTNVAKFTEDHHVQLKPGLAIGGIVRQTSGKPVAGAQVVIHRVTRVSPHHYDRVDYDSVFTGADGKWTSTSLPPDLSGLSFHVTHAEYAPGHFVTAGFAPPPTSTSSSSSSSSSSSAAVTYRRLADGTLVPMNQPRAAAKATPMVTSNALLAMTAEMALRPAPLVQGTLAGPDGKPISGAELIAGAVSAPLSARRVTTDAEGKFRFHVPDPGMTGLVGVREGFAPFHQFVTVTTNMAPLKLQMQRPRTLQGRVQDRRQRPVAGATVRLEDWHGTTDIVRFQATTDERGEFVWSNAPVGQVTFVMSKTNYYNSRQSFTVGSGPIVLSLNQPPGIYGRVYDAETKKPIESFVVTPGRKYSENQTQVQWERSEAMRGRNGEYTLRVDSYMFQPEARLMVEAPGYQPQISPPFKGSDSYTNDFALEKGQGITGTVAFPDGSPAANATVVLVERGENGYLQQKGQLRGSGSGDTSRTDAQGRFAFMPRLDPAMIFASHDRGFGEASVGKTNRIVLAPWGSIKGVFRVGNRIEPEQMVRLENRWLRYYDDSNRPTTLAFTLKVTPEADGSFTYEKVPPGEHRLSLEYRFRENQNGGETPLSHGMFVPVKSGQAAQVTLGGTGRRVTGRVNLTGGDHGDVDWKRDVHKLTLILPPPVIRPAAIQGRTSVEQQRAWNDFNLAERNFWNSEAGRAREREEKTYVLVFDTNGVFHVDNVPPGQYSLSLKVSDPEEEYYSGRSIGTTNLPVKVPEEAAAGVNAPFEIGSIDLAIQPRIKLGRPVPSFSAKTADGKTVNLSDYRGKHVLLYFWGTSVGYSTLDLQVLKELQNAYGGADGKLVLLGCNQDANQQNAVSFVGRQGMTWTQIYLGDWNQTTVPGLFGIRGNSACVLIDPEGRLASGQLRGSNIRNAVANALAGER